MKAAMRYGADVNTTTGLCGLNLPDNIDHFCRYLRLELLDTDVISEQFTLCDGEFTPLIL